MGVKMTNNIEKAIEHVMHDYEKFLETARTESAKKREFGLDENIIKELLLIVDKREDIK